MSVDLVIAAYKVGYEWARGLSFDRMFVYDKGEGEGCPKPFLLPSQHFTRMVDVGKCDHSYLQHIIDHYDDLADWTVFAPDNLSDKLGNHCRIEDMMIPGNDLRFPWLCRVRDWGHDGRLRWHTFTNRKDRNGTNWKERWESGIVTPAVMSFTWWSRKYLGFDPDREAWPGYHPGDIFGVPRHCLTRYPREFWVRLRDQLAGSMEPEEGHYMERLWLVALQGQARYFAEGGGPTSRPEVDERPKVCIGIPSYGSLTPKIIEGLVVPSRKDLAYTIQLSVGSLLTLSFNQVWVKALNSRIEQPWTHFAMHHSDIEAPAGWLDTLIEEMRRVNADVLSVVVPIKDARGLTSTGLMHESGKIRRLTMKEIHQLPDTFDAKQAGAKEGEFLAINTGLWICNFRQPWIEDFPGFTICDEIRREPDGSRRAVAMPEDWGFSQWLHKRGLRVCATRKVAVSHYGPAAYTNTEPWGTFDTDKGDDYVYDPVTKKETTAA